MSTRPMRLEIYREVDRPDTVSETVTGYWRWRIKASNGRILADSGEAYGRLRDCAHGAGLVAGLDDPELRPGWDITGWYANDGRAWRIVVDA